MRNKPDRYGIDRSMRILTLPAACLGLAGCQTMVPLAPPPPQPSTTPISQSCHTTESRDWQAWINAMPGPNAQPRLIVTGKFTAPSGGFSYRWGSIRVMESYPVQVSVELITIPPAGYASDALVEHEVRGEWPMTPPVGSLTISCGGRMLGRVSPVETVH